MADIVNHEAMENSPETKSYYDNKPLLYRNVLWLLFGGAAAGFGLNTAQSLMPMHMTDIGMNAQQVSFALALNGWIGIPLILYISYLSDHWQWKMGRRLPFLIISLPPIVVAMVLFPYTATAGICIPLYLLFTFFVNVKSNTYPFLTYDISRKKYWGRVTGIYSVMAAVFVWLGQIVLMPMVGTHGKKTVYVLGVLLVAIPTVLTVVFLKEPPLRSAQPPRFNPVPVIWSALKLGFEHKRNILLFLAFGLNCGLGLVFYYVPLQAKVNLGLTEGQVGTHILQYGTLVGVLFFFFMGWTIDKIGPVKSMAFGYTFAVLAMLIGFDPRWSSHVITDYGGFFFSPTILLAAAYLSNMAATNFIYMAGSIFVLSSVARENVATFAACNGAVNLFIRSWIMSLAGTLTTKVFHENYGFAFVAGTAMATCGIPLFFIIDRWRKKATVPSDVIVGMEKVDAQNAS